MLTTIKSRSDDGIVKPRVVAHSLQIAKLLDLQKQQRLSDSQILPVARYAKDGYIAGAVFYFMVEHIQHCNAIQACDPSRGALFHWLDDTFRRVQALDSQDEEKVNSLVRERGAIIQFLLAEKPSFSVLTSVAQTLSPYDLEVFIITSTDRFKIEHVAITSKNEFYNLLQKILSQYLTDGLAILHQYKRQNQVLDMRFLLRSMATMRAFARGFAKAAWFNKDFVIAAQCFAFSGDINQTETREFLQHLVEQQQNILPDSCEQILQVINQAKQDWFTQFTQIYQGDSVSSSPSVATNS